MIRIKTTIQGVVLCLVISMHVGAAHHMPAELQASQGQTSSAASMLQDQAGTNNYTSQAQLLQPQAGGSQSLVPVNKQKDDEEEKKRQGAMQVAAQSGAAAYKSSNREIVLPSGDLVKLCGYLIGAITLTYGMKTAANVINGEETSTLASFVGGRGFRLSFW